MTKDEIMAMPAGPDMDRLVAEALGKDTATLPEHDWGDEVEVDDGIHSGKSCRRCGAFWNTCACDNRHVPAFCTPHIGRYSGDIGMAWRVWEAMRSDAIYVEMDQDREGNAHVIVHRQWGEEEPIGGSADTVPLAICRAFLLLKSEGGAA